MSEPRTQRNHNPSRRSLASVRTITLLIFAATLLAYVLLLTKNFYWDGIFFAQVIEDAPRINATLVHPSHLVDLIFQYLLFRTVRLFGFQARALTILQLSNCVLAAASVAVFFRICIDWFESLYVSLVVAALFAFSATWWRFATDADTYIGAVLLLLVAFYFLRVGRAPQPFSVALAHAVAMLLHQLCVFFFPVAVAGLILQARKSASKNDTPAILKYAVSATALTLAVYYLVFHVAADSWSLTRFGAWITYFSPENGFSFNALGNLGYSLRSQVRVFAGGRAAFVREFGGPLMILLVVLTVLVTLAFVFMLLRHWKELKPTFPAIALGLSRFKPLTTLSVLWILPYVVFLFFFIPQNVFYRLFYLPPILLLIGSALAAIEGTPNHVRRYRAALLAAAIFFANLTFSQYPYAQARANPPLELAHKLNKVWGTGTVVYFASANTDDSLIRYFNPRTIWVQVAPADFIKQIEQLPPSARTGWLDSTLIDQLEVTVEGREWLAKHSVRRFDCELVNQKFRIRFYQMKS
jgi:hypothetical protein